MDTLKKDIAYIDFLSENQRLIYDGLNNLKDHGLMYQYFEDETFNGRTVKVNGSDLLHFGSCSYMGFETHPGIIKSSREALEKYKTQTPSSRAALSSVLYREIEDTLPQIFPGKHIITQTVTLGHFSILPLLIQDNDAIILDAFAHNSIRMACSVCKANGTFVIISKNNDIDNVRYLTKRLKKEGYRNIWYCTDGLFSMHGNFLHIKELYQLLNEENNFFAYIDDAHGTGWYGEKGCGYVFQNVDIHPRMIVIESFAKTLVSSGGLIVVQDKELANIIRISGQTMIFSGPLQPAILGSVKGALEVLLSKEFKIYQKELTELINYFRETSKKHGIPIITEDETPIQFLKIGNVDKTISLMEQLKVLGFFTISAIYPAVSKEDCGLRISLTRHLKKVDIDNLLQNIEKLLKING